MWELLVAFFFPPFLWCNETQVWCGVWCKEIASSPCSSCKIKFTVLPLSVRGSCSTVSECGPAMCHHLLKVTIMLSAFRANKRMWPSRYTFSGVVLKKWFWHCVGVNKQTFYKLCFSSTCNLTFPLWCSAFSTTLSLKAIGIFFSQLQHSPLLCMRLDFPALHCRMA